MPEPPIIEAEEEPDLHTEQFHEGQIQIPPLIELDVDESEAGTETETDVEEEGEDESEDEDEEEPDTDNAYFLQSSSVLQMELATATHPNDNSEEEREVKWRRADEGEALSQSREEIKVRCSAPKWNRGEIDGLFCPICMEAWTSGGEHHVCCLPCGHIYGMSCIKKWIQQRRSTGKCPQCNKRCTTKDVRRLYASRIVVVDEQSQKKICSLEAKCGSLEKANTDWCKKEVEWRKREADLQLQVHRLRERTTYLELLLKEKQSRLCGLSDVSQDYQSSAAPVHDISSMICREGSSTFVFKKELLVDGARLFDIDTFTEILIIARRLPRMGGTHVVTKMSLIPPYESENILLPSSTKAIRDLCVSPYNCKLALLASLGKKLTILSIESNHIVLTCDLAAPAWSCSWDLNSSHYIYAGLQNGMLMVFDVRQTSRPFQSLSGLTSNPVHTIYSLPHNSTPGVRSLLTASSIGVSEWSLSDVEYRPFLVPGSENQGVCISLAYCSGSDDVVASFRPKVAMSDEAAVSQSSLTPLSTIGHSVVGSHVLLGRTGSCYQRLGSTHTNTNNIRLPKSVIIGRENQHTLFATEDEAMGELVLHDLPSFEVVQCLKPQNHPIHDVKYAHALTHGLLGCLSANSLQLFSAQFSC